jgi:hypothetical protein
MAPEEVNPEEFDEKLTPEEQQEINSITPEQMACIIEEGLMPLDPEDDGMDLKDGVLVFRPDHPRWRTFIDGGTIKWRSKLKERKLVPTISEVDITKYIVSEADPKTGRTKPKHLYIPDEDLDKYVKDTLTESTLCWYPDNSVMLLYLKDQIPVDAQDEAKEGLDAMHFEDPHRAETKGAIEFNEKDGMAAVRAGELTFGFSAQGSIELMLTTRETGPKSQRAQFDKLKPLLRKLTDLYAVVAPKSFGYQNRQIKDFRLSGTTAFSTITVLRSCPSAIHRDTGNSKTTDLSLTCMTTVRGTDYEGGAFCLPEYGLKIPVQPGDVLIAATAREWHCNLTPVRGTKYSIVCYYLWRLASQKMMAKWAERQKRRRDSVQAPTEPVPLLQDGTMKRGQKVRQKSAPGRTGTVIMDNEPGEAILVKFEDETVAHQFLAEELDLIGEP